VIDEFEIALVGGHAACHVGLDVVEHLIGSGLDDMDRAFAELLRGRYLRGGKTRGHKQSRLTFCDGGFENLYGFFVGGSSGVAGADVMIIREDASDLAIDVDAVNPVGITGTHEGGLLFRRHLGFLLGGELRRWLAEVTMDPAAVTAGIQCGDHGFAVGSNPQAYVEWNSNGGLLRRIGAADQRGWLPAGVELLRGESFDSRVSQDGGQRSRETEAVGQHVLRAGFAEILAEVFIAVEKLAKESLGAGKVDIALFDGRAGREPAALGGIFLHPRIVVRVVLFHQAIAVGAGPVEDIVRILIHVIEVDAHGLQQVFADGLREVPAPLCVEMGVGNYIQCWRGSDVGCLHGLGMCCAGEACCRKRSPNHNLEIMNKPRPIRM
jgi:hypothetical protein